MTGSATATSAVNFNDLLGKAKSTLDDHQLDSIEMLEVQLQQVRGDKEKTDHLKNLGEKWTKSGNVIVAGKYLADAALIDGDEKTWSDAANHFFIGFPTTTDSLAKLYAVQEAIKCYQQLQILDSTNMDYRVHEALCYVDGMGQVMQGVSILKEVEKKDPNNKDMNLILGRLAVVSGQYDKAVTRLEQLTKTDPTNAEAFFHLAEAYRALGRKDDAIKALEQCKLLVKDPDFAAQIDSYINQIKNS